MIRKLNVVLIYKPDDKSFANRHVFTLNTLENR